MSNLKEIKCPKMNEDLAEFLGICFGDGHLHVDKKRFDYYLLIAGHLTDDDLYLKNHIAVLLKNLFDLRPKFWIRRNINTLYLCVRSKKLVIFLHKAGMPIGKKMTLKTPKEIKNDTNLMIAFIRGLTDTDGTLTFRKKHKKLNYYPSIALTWTCKSFLVEIKKFLDKQEFLSGKIVDDIDKYYSKPYLRHRLFLYGSENVEKWFKVIGLNNPKHLSKYHVWKKYGYCPPSLSTPERLKMLESQ